MEIGYSGFLLLIALFSSVLCADLSIDLSTLHLAYKDEIKAYIEKQRVNEGGSVFKRTLPQIKYYLFIKEYDSFDLLNTNDTDSVSKSHFKASTPTKVLIHGWMDSAFGDMVTTVKKGFFDGSEDVNVLGVDWSDISVTLNYLEAARKTGEVGKEVAKMVDFLVEQGAKVDDFHVIGHSLGAHVAGYVGRSVTSGKLSRITGLDPALPGFEVISVAHKLEKTDAMFVDCIHTCGGTLGILGPHCHVDFYPNGGVFDQPGCPTFDFGKCSHFRAFDYFAESVNTDHKFPTLYCGNKYIFEWNCQSSSEVMGYPVNSLANGTYYLTTGFKYPYAPVLN